MRTSNHRTPPRRLPCALVICGLALAAPAALLAEGPGEAGAPPPAPVGWRAYLDPETGELTSTPSREQVEALAAKIQAEAELAKSLGLALSRTSADLEPFTLERGGRGVYLAGRFQSALIVRRGDDGRFALVCADDAEHAGSALAAPAPAPAASQDRVEK